MTAKAIYIRDGWVRCQACRSLFLLTSVQEQGGITEAKHCPSCGEEVEVWFGDGFENWENGTYVFGEF